MNYKIFCGDSLEVMKQMKKRSIDITCTSPPYNIGSNYEKYKDKIDYKKYLLWIRDVCLEIKRLLKPNGSFFFNIGSTNIHPDIHYNIYEYIKDIFVLQNEIVWVKSIAIGDDPGLSFGHYKPINSNRFIHIANEKIFHFTNMGNIKLNKLDIGLPYKWKCNRKNRKTGEMGIDLRCRGNTWYIPYETIQNKKERFYHPAPFPIRLPENCIKLHGFNKNTVVLDPFFGIGNTLLACKKLGVNCIGIDINNNYCEISRKRMEKNEG